MKTGNAIGRMNAAPNAEENAKRRREKEEEGKERKIRRKRGKILSREDDESRRN